MPTGRHRADTRTSFRAGLLVFLRVMTTGGATVLYGGKHEYTRKDRP